MKHFALYLGIAAAMVVSCSIQEENFEVPQQDEVMFYASFEQPSEETKVYANEDLLLRWTSDDRVSIFNKNTYNQQYKFLGETGDNAGGFSEVSGASFVTGNEISHIISVYPYQEGTKITEDEVITLTLPAEQLYAENTFGLGANTMVAVSEGNVLQYKNVCGYLRISLYGQGVSVSSIKLKGNSGEKLAGKATVTMPLDGLPSVEMTNEATDEITLVSDSSVKLGATAEESVDFWFVVPPVTFSKGFTINVYQAGGVSEITTSRSITIERNNLSKMSPIEVEPIQRRNVIYYTSSDGSVVTPYSSEWGTYSPDSFGANILSNEYVDGQGILTFDGDVTSIGDYAFAQCSNLTGITIPDSVKSIGQSAFYGCSSLTSFTIPDSVTSIENFVFSGCSSLTGITIPDSVTSIGWGAFDGCSSLTSITIPDSVKSIGQSAFYGCSSLTSFSIPDSVTSIDGSTFYGCSSLTSITIPDSVTSIGLGAFYGCSSLTSFSIPDSVTSIGSGAFCGCSSLTSIAIPDSVTSIKRAFNGCISLVSFSGKYASPDGLFLIDSGCLFDVAVGAMNGDVSIPDSVLSIGDSAFRDCSSITSITIPDSVTSIGGSAFDGCSSLTSITIPNSVTSIGWRAFFECSSLTSITIPDSVTSIEDYVFSQCSSLIEISIPDSVTSIGKGAFHTCSSLTSITIPDSVTSIGSSAFRRCSSLSSLTIPNNVTSIGERAFEGCTSLTDITLLPTTPPAGGSTMFGNTNKAPIYVPAGSVDAYKSAEYWRSYADRIQAIP